jgi:hypothetical protein
MPIVDGEEVEHQFTPFYTPPKFEARLKEGGWTWEIWDVTHPSESNHFVIVTVDSKGAADDFHEPFAKLIAAVLTTGLKQHDIETASKILGMSLCVGKDLHVYGEYEAISRTQQYVLLDTNHPIEKEDVKRIFARSLQAIERAQGASIGTTTERR